MTFHFKYQILINVEVLRHFLLETPQTVLFSTIHMLKNVDKFYILFWLKPYSIFLKTLNYSLVILMKLNIFPNWLQHTIWVKLTLIWGFDDLHWQSPSVYDYILIGDPSNKQATFINSLYICIGKVGKYYISSPMLIRVDLGS